VDFRLFDDGIEQNILYFERERVRFIRSSRGLEFQYDEKDSICSGRGLSLLDSLEEQDQYRDNTHLEHGKRSKLLMPSPVMSAMSSVDLPLFLTPTNESTALFDGIYLGVSTAHQDAANRHRAMIIITDGGDNHSRYNFSETKELLEEADVPVLP